jgi:RNA polymerase sigma-70 factor (ECF subfamily)
MRKKRRPHKAAIPRPVDPKEQRKLESRIQDSRLIREALTGDDRAFKKLMRKYHDAIYNFIFRMIRGREQVEDLTRKLPMYSINKPIESKNSSYAFELPDDSLQADRALISSQRTKMLNAAIAKLPEKYKQVIRLRHTEERSYEEIAAILKLPLGTVKAHIFRARELLYKTLKDKIRNY